MDDKRRSELLKIVEKSYKKLDAPVQHRLVVAFDALIFNLTAFLCLIAIINDRKKIAAEDIEQLKAYVDSKCAARAAWLARQQQAGGSVTPMPASFYGFQEPTAYTGSAVPALGGTVNFGANIARAAIHGGAPAATKKILAGNKDVANMVASIVKLHEMEITKADITKLQGYFDIYIHCFVDTIPAESMTVEFINKELKKPFHIMFQ